ncbi:GNT-I family protein [Nitzschia inconspicua]|uniref:GNT-I family protein n=1 Tax=Nitzschia inconspicua TaxID=303405 RepID=A0A9K3LPV1_9STRA|nr:GNT-I family protein [Nitzschia inconspicua]
MVHILKHDPTLRRRRTNGNSRRSSSSSSSSLNSSDRILAVAFQQRKVLCAVAIVVWAWMAGFFAVYYHFLVGRPTWNGDDTVSSSQTGGSSQQQQQQQVVISTTQSNKDDVYDSPLLIFTCHRAYYLKETLQHVYDALPNCRLGVGCPIIISEDGSDHKEIDLVLEEFKTKFDAKNIPVIHIQHHNNPISQSNNVRVGDPNAAYKALAKHFGWALTRVFDGNIPGDYKPSYPNYYAKFPLPQRVIILEEDIKVAPDFFSYMAATAKVLDVDPTLYAVSAFNDNGHLIQEDSERLLRSDFFPGLGWMMTRSLWKDDLESKWPDGFWDDWMREPAQRKGRQVIRPEVSRTYHFGRKGGASANQFGSILERVKLDTHIVDWQQQDLSYLMRDEFQKRYTALVNGSTLASSLDDAKTLLQHGNVRLEYDSFHGFQHFAKSLRIMDDEKAMVPRTAYNGIVESRPFGTGNILFLVPKGGKPFYH